MVCVFYSRDILAAEKYLDLEWIYLGSDNELERILLILDRNRRKYVAQDIERITNSVRENFINFIGRISLYQRNRLLWYTSSVASKSVFQTTIFEQYVYIKLLEALSRDSKEYLLITDNIELLRNLKEIEPDFVHLEINSLPSQRKSSLFYKRLYRVCKNIFFCLLCRVLFKTGNLGKADVLLYSPIDDRVFGELPVYSDNYFGNLNPFLLEHKRNTFRITQLEIPLKLVLNLRRYFKDVAPPFALISLSNLVKTLIARFAIDIPDEDFECIEDTRLLKYLLQEEQKKENENLNFQSNLFYFYAFSRLDKILNKNAAFIYIFENQPWEKMVNMAMEQRRRIGYQHTIIPINQLDYTLSNDERDTPLPSVILTSGKKWSDFLASYYPGVNIEIAGALRLSHLWSGPKISRLPVFKNIVLALPIYSPIAFSLQRQLLKILKNPDSFIHGYKIKIKPHPYLIRKDVLFEDFNKFSNCEFVNLDISELIMNSELLISSSSTVVFESICKNCKTLYFIPESIPEGTDFFIREHLFIAFENNFGVKLEEALTSTTYPDIKTEDYFAPPDYSRFLKYTDCTGWAQESKPCQSSL